MRPYFAWRKWYGCGLLDVSSVPPIHSTGILRIDRLLSEDGEPPLEQNSKDGDAIGVVHDLINRFDYRLKRMRPFLPPRATWRGAPLPGDRNYMVFDGRTAALVSAYQKLRERETTGKVDRGTLASLIAEPASKALITSGHAICEHGFKHSHFLKALALTAGRECRFDSTVMNLNDDGAGLSLGVLHWAQKPGRLYELIVLLRELVADVRVFDRAFGDDATVQGMIAHLKKDKNGLTATGASNNPRYEFTRALAGQKNWIPCFKSVLATRDVQYLSLEYAMHTYRRMYDESYQGYPSAVKNLAGHGLTTYAPKLKSERAVVFALDMINQHGWRVRSLYKKYTAAKPDATEAQILTALREGARNYWLGLKAPPTLQGRQRNADADSERRDFFLNTPNLASDKDFDPA